MPKFLAATMLAACLSVLAVVASPTVIAAPADDPVESEPGPAEAADGAPTEAPVPGATPDRKPLIPKFQQGSGQRAGGPANELNTGDQRAVEKPPGGSVAGALANRELYHGNYCGQGGRTGLAPADDLDAACMRHDECYEAARYRSCACDQTLKREAVAIADSNVYSREIRARAGSIAQAAELMECRRP